MEERSMKRHTSAPVVSRGFAAAVFALAPSAAHAGLYTVDYIGNSLFAITSMNGNNTDKERRQRFITNFDHTVPMNDTFQADSFSGTGSAAAYANVQLSMTSTTVSWSGSISNALSLGDAASVHCQTESALDMLFTVSQPTLFTYSGNAGLSINPVSTPPFTGIASLLWAQGGSGTLAPGQYRVFGQVKLLYEINGNSPDRVINSTGQFNIEMTFAPVPAPGAAVLGLAGVLAFSSRRRPTRRTTAGASEIVCFRQ